MKRHKKTDPLRWLERSAALKLENEELLREITAYQISKDNEDLRNEANALLMEMYPKGTAWRLARNACEPQPFWQVY